MNHGKSERGKLSSAVERELARVLLTTLHLSVGERRLLPNGRVRFSVLTSAIRCVLEESGWFPSPLEPGTDIGDGAVLELRDGELWLHQQHEVGVCRFSPIQSSLLPDLAAAARAYIEHYGGSPLDGVDID